MAKSESKKTMKITKARVENLETIPKGQVFIWDTELKGFGLRITPGNISYICQGRVKGETVRVTIGRHGVWYPDKARKQARGHLQDMSNGIDPRAKKKEQEAAGLTLEDVTAQYIKDRGLKPSTIWTIDKHMNGALNAWKKKPVLKISRDDVLKKFREISEDKPTQANQAFRHLRAILNHARATKKPFLPDNPVDVIREAKIWNPSKAKNGRIPIEKVGKAWAYLQDLKTETNRGTTHVTIDLITFLLFSGARIGEARFLTWDMIDLDAGTWFLADPKNKKPIKRPMNTQVLNMLKNRQQKSGFVFPGMKKQCNVVDIRSILNKVGEYVGVKLTPHDLRRTFTGIANQAGVEFWKVKLLMGHTVKNDVTLQNYAETDNLTYLQPDIQKISDWIEQQAEIHRAGNVIDMNTRKAVKK